MMMPRDEALARAKKLEGWTLPAELDWLYDRATEHSFILEIGVWKGRSTFALGAGARRCVVGVDNFSGSPGEDLERFLKEAKTASGRRAIMGEAIGNLQELLDTGKAVLFCGSSIAAGLLFGVSTFDMIFIDGSHDFVSVRRDLMLAITLASDDCLICGHDYDNDHPGVIEAVTEAFRDNVGRGPGSIWFKKGASDGRTT